MTSSDFRRLQEAVDHIHRIARARAVDSWSRLPEAARATLISRQLTPRLWGLSFGYELGRYLTRHVSDPDSADAAVADAWTVPDEEVDVLAMKHASRLLAGDDSVLRGTAVFSAMEGLSPEPAPPTDVTPFDGIVDRLWGSREDITIGPFRLVGALELIGMVLLAILVWIPATLAVTYRVLHGKVSGGTLAKAAIGWLGIVLALAEVLSWM